MLGVNKVILVGNLGKAPQVKYMDDGKAVASFTVATHRLKKSTEGNRDEVTEWHRIAAFGRTGEIAGQILDKGSAVYLEGRLVPKQWIDESGNTRYGHEIWANSLQVLGPKRSAAVGVVPNAAPGAEADIPF